MLTSKESVNFGQSISREVKTYKNSVVVQFEIAGYRGNWRDMAE